jgi:dihydrofolate synthase / folylpolyglutamate synthase
VTFDDLKRLLFERSNFGMKLGLARMRAALALLADPHRCAPVLHVAGTNGKGSTCAFTERSLRAAGLKTGLYTSPHLRHFCERIRVAGEPISEEEAADLLGELLRRVPWALSGGPEGPADGDGLTFFEIATLLAFLAFARAGVEVMVIEVGLGGRLDATNVVEPLACAIAPLGLEHQQYLGHTLAQIAAEKAGIIKEGVPVVSAGQPLEAARVLEQVARARSARLLRPGRDYRFESRPGLPFCYGSGPEGAACG